MFHQARLKGSQVKLRWEIENDCVGSGSRVYLPAYHGGPRLTSKGEASKMKGNFVIHGHFITFASGRDSMSSKVS
ncbi:unnamed protein product, partial [Nesidiocoris tenuis]